jgi:organic hydroperoxide reductase OsmC/OhrA
VATADTTKATHRYAARLVWTGNTGEGTARYAGYGRGYAVHVAGKPELHGSADPAFHGAPDRHNPEDLFLASIAACHMLSYLALCARHGVPVFAYEDEATGTLAMHAGGGGRFEEVLLAPVVTVADDADAELAKRLHDIAHERCFIASSCSIAIRHRPTILTAARDSARAETA